MPQSNPRLFLHRMSADQGAKIEVHENKKENDPTPNSAEVTPDHIETELQGTE